MNTPVTVLMPNYNNELFLKEAINSILKQTFKDFIFLIVDDGSTDKSIEIIKSYADPRIRLIQKESNSGIVDTLNLGIRNIDTKYYVRMDGDDISVPERIQLLYDFMEQNPEVGVCGSHALLFGNINTVWKHELNRKRIKAKIIYCGGVSHGPSIYRTSVLKDNNIYYTNNHPYMEDYDLFFRLKKHTEYAHLDKVLYQYRVLGHNSTVKNKSTSMMRHKEMYRDVLHELKIETSDANLEKHLQLFQSAAPITFKLKEYRKWIGTIIRHNEREKIYPQEELKQILEEMWKQFFFKVVPGSLAASINYFSVSGKITYNQLMYLSKVKINKLIGRNQNP